jgi:hypothetical protein
MTGIPDLLRVVLLSLPLTLTLLAGVTYDQTVRTGTLDGSQLLQSRVPSIDPPVFDITSRLYAPPLGGPQPTASEFSWRATGWSGSEKTSLRYSI